MAYGNRTNSQSNGKLLVFKIISKGKDSSGKEVPIMPHQFQVSEKVGDKWTAQSEMVSNVSGNLTKIEEKQKEFNGDKYDIIQLYLSAADEQGKPETYLLDLRYSQDGRSLINSLDSLETFDNLGISLYAKKGKGANAKTYSNIALRQNDDMVYGKTKLADLPKATPILDKAGKLVKNDYSDIDAFYKERVKDLIKRVDAANKNAKKSAPAPTKTKAAAAVSAPLDEDVPF